MPHWVYSLLIPGFSFSLLFEKPWFPTVTTVRSGKAQKQMARELSVYGEGPDARGTSLWLGHYFLSHFFFHFTILPSFLHEDVGRVGRMARSRRLTDYPTSLYWILTRRHGHLHFTRKGQKARKYLYIAEWWVWSHAFVQDALPTLPTLSSARELRSKVWDEWLPEMLF